MQASIEVRAQRALEQSPFYSFRHLKVKKRGKTFHLTGPVGMYYHKQRAQEAVRKVAPRALIANDIQVMGGHNLAASPTVGEPAVLNTEHCA